MTDTNPFAAKAHRARSEHERLTAPTAQQRAMADAFPLGAGSPGNSSARRSARGAGRRMDASIDRAVRAENARKNALHYEGLAAAYDRGEVNAQGRRITSEATREREATAADLYGAYLRARVQPGDEVTLVQNPDGGGHVVTRINRKTVTFATGTQWPHIDIRPLRNGQPMTSDELREDFAAWRAAS
jgi:hypothetical protein